MSRHLRHGNGVAEAIPTLSLCKHKFELLKQLAKRPILVTTMRVDTDTADTAEGLDQGHFPVQGMSPESPEQP